MRYHRPPCNLVWNGSFEQTLNGACPAPPNTSSGSSLLGGFGRDVAGGPNDPPPYLVICNWRNANAGSADLFNTCAAPATLGAPCNYATICQPGGQGGQYARSGSGYAGIIAYRDAQTSSGISNVDDWREYVTQPVALQTNQRYYLEYYATLATGARLTVPKLGAALSTSASPYTGTGPVPLTPVVERNVSATPGSWTRIANFFTATGLEQQLLIGNFGASPQTVGASMFPSIFREPTAPSSASSGCRPWATSSSRKT